MTDEPISPNPATPSHAPCAAHAPAQPLTGEAPRAKRSIFDIAEELDQIAIAFDQLEDGGEEQAVLDAIERYFGDLLIDRDRKLDNYARFIADRQALAAAQKAEAERILALSRTNENQAKRLKERLKVAFELNGWTKIETPLHKFGMQKNGGKPPLEIHPYFLENPEHLPERFQRIEISADTEAIRAALVADPETVTSPVADFVARLGEPGTHLRIR